MSVHNFRKREEDGRARPVLRVVVLLSGLENRDRAFVSEGHHVASVRDHGMTALALFVVPLGFAFVIRNSLFAAECCEAVCGERCCMKIALAHLMFS